MKKFIVCLIAILFLTKLVFANDKDSGNANKPQQVEIKVTVDNKDSTKNTTAIDKSIIEKCKTCNSDKVKGVQWVLVFLPTVFFLLLFYYYMGWLKKDGYKIADALSSCEPLTLTQETKDAAGNVTASIGNQVLPRSSSRLIAFLTGLTAMVIGLCLTTYYIFISLADCPNPDLDGLWKVIASLGIGIIPYGANMWKESKKDNN
jgi:hypothetical protein